MSIPVWLNLRTVCECGAFNIEIVVDVFCKRLYRLPLTYYSYPILHHRSNERIPDSLLYTFPLSLNQIIISYEYSHR